MKLISPIALAMAAGIALTATLVVSQFSISASGAADTDKPRATTPPPAPAPPAFEGSMTLDRIDTIVRRLDTQAKQARKGVWQFRIEGVPVIIVTDTKYDRMRILVGIKKSLKLTRDELMRISQANFDSALDARYAIAKGVLWAAYIHPLHALYDKQFISAIGQTVNIAREYGRSYSSGALLYGGGDSGAIMQQQLIKKLQKKGLDI